MKKYSKIWLFNNGFAIVLLNNKFGFINENYEEICEIKYDYVYNFISGLSIVRIDRNYGLINTSGIEIIDIKYNFYEINNILYQYIKNHNRNLKLNLIV